MATSSMPSIRDIYKPDPAGCGGLTALLGQPDLPDSQFSPNLTIFQSLRNSECPVFLKEDSFRWHTVATPQITAVGYRYAQVIDFFQSVKHVFLHNLLLYHPPLYPSVGCSPNNLPPTSPGYSRHKTGWRTQTPGRLSPGIRPPEPMAPPGLRRYKGHTFQTPPV